MFFATLKATIKNILRSITFWLTVSVLIIVVAQASMGGFYLGDDNPQFVLNYKDYVQCIINALVSNLLMYALPLFAVISTVLILNRDYGDNFFEIEKSANIKPASYVCGRLSSLVLVNFLALLLFNLLCVYWYVFSRGGVEGLTTPQVISETFVRVLRVDVFVGMPTLIFYIGLTYFVGSIFKNGIPAAIVGMGYVIGFYAGYLRLRFQIPEDYFNYFSPIPKKLRQFFHYYDTEWFEDMITQQKTSVTHVAFCISFLVGVAAVCSVISYLRLRRREV